MFKFHFFFKNSYFPRNRLREAEIINYGDKRCQYMNVLKNERSKIKFDIFSTDRKLLLKAFALIRLSRKPFPTWNSKLLWC